MIGSVFVVCIFSSAVLCQGPPEKPTDPCVAITKSIPNYATLSQNCSQRILISDDFFIPLHNNFCSTLEADQSQLCALTMKGRAEIPILLHSTIKNVTDFNSARLCSSFGELFRNATNPFKYELSNKNNCLKACSGEPVEPFCTIIYSLNVVIQSVSKFVDDAATVNNQQTTTANNQQTTTVKSNKTVYATTKKDPTVTAKNTTEFIASPKVETEAKPEETTTEKSFPKTDVELDEKKTDVAVEGDKKEPSPPSEAVSHVNEPVAPKQTKMDASPALTKPAVITSPPIPTDLDRGEEGEEDIIEDMPKEEEPMVNPKVELFPMSKPQKNPDSFTEVEDSNFFSYFMLISLLFIIGYVLYHNKQKVFALLLEGRKDQGGRRRPNTAGYRKLNSNLEEAVTSKCSTSASNVIY